MLFTGTEVSNMNQVPLKMTKVLFKVNSDHFNLN